MNDYKYYIFKLLYILHDTNYYRKPASRGHGSVINVSKKFKFNTSEYVATSYSMSYCDSACHLDRILDIFNINNQLKYFSKFFV